MQLITRFAVDEAGNIIPLAIAHVYLRNTQTLATGLVNEAGAPITNPFQATDKALVKFRIPNGEYDLKFTGGGREYTVPFQAVDLQEQVAQAQAQVAATTAAGAVQVALAAGHATASLNSANASAASAATAAEVANIGDVQKFTQPLRQAIAALFAGATSANTGIQIPSNVQNNHGTNDFTVHWKGYLADYTPSSDQVLRRKHDGTNGYILSIRTTGVIRLQLNGFIYDSTVSITTEVADGDVVEIDVAIIRETATAAGQILYIVNGVQLGAAVVIAAHGDLTTELITNGTFDTDLAGWIISNQGTGTTTWDETGAMRCTGTNGSNRSNSGRNIPTVPGATYEISITSTVAVGGAFPRIGTTSDGVDLLQMDFNGFVGTRTARFVATTATSYLRMNSYGTHVYDNITVKRIATADNTATEFIMGSSTTQTAGGWLRSLTYNRAISALDVLSRIKRGVPIDDLTPPNKSVSVSNPTFDPDGTGWVSSAGGSINSIVSGGEAALNSSTLQQIGTNVGSMPSLGRVRIRLVLRSSGATVRLQIRLTTNDYFTNNRLVFESASVNYSTGTVVEINVAGDGIARNMLWIREQNGSGGTIHVDRADIWSEGITADYSADNIQSNTGQVFDSANGNHGVMPASRAIRSETSRLPAFRSRHAWVNTSEEQYITLFNQNVVPANLYFEGIVVIPTGDTLTGFTIGNGSNSSYYATVEGPLTAGVPIYVTLTQRYPNTNRKLTIKPSGTFNGQLAVTAFGRILETA